MARGNTGSYRRLLNADGDCSSSTRTARASRRSVRFSPGTHGLETLSKTIVTNESWKKVRVEVRYARPGGTVRFEQVGLTFESPPV